MVNFLSKFRKITVVKIVNLPGKFPVINSCGKEGGCLKFEVSGLALP